MTRENCATNRKGEEKSRKSRDTLWIFSRFNGGPFLSYHREARTENDTCCVQHGIFTLSVLAVHSFYVKKDKRFISLLLCTSVPERTFHCSTEERIDPVFLFLPLKIDTTASLIRCIDEREGFSGSDVIFYPSSMFGERRRRGGGNLWVTDHFRERAHIDSIPREETLRKDTKNNYQVPYILGSLYNS